MRAQREKEKEKEKEETKEERQIDPVVFLSWDTTEVIQAQADFLREQHSQLSEDEAFRDASEDSDIIALAWEDLLGELDIYLKKVGTGLWYCEVRDFGWRKTSGYKNFRAATAEQFLRAILPNTDCTFKIHTWGTDGLAINNAHHDSPWDEWYYLRPLMEGEEV